MRRPNTPTVVFIDDGPLWHSFQQVAALVRCHGYQTVRITTAPTGRLGRLADRLLYHCAFYLSGAAELDSLPTMLEPFRLAKIWATETLLEAIDDHVFEGLPGDIAVDLRTRKRFSDKTAAAALAIGQGALVPEELPGTTPPVEAAERLGVPLVLKSHFSAAGSGVHIAHTLADVEQSSATMGAADEFFYQRFVPGQLVSYGAMVADGEIVQELTYRGLDSSSNPTGAPLSYEVIEDPGLTEIGRSICRGVGIRGPINLQAIRDADGRHWVIDLNIRPFGGMLNYDQNQVDTATGFLFSTQMIDNPPVHRKPPPGLIISEFPTDAEELARNGRYGAALNVYLRRAPSFVRLLRVNYITFAILNGIALKLGI